MSKKKLDRSILEGGRASSNVWDRRHSNRVARSSARIAAHKYSKDPELADYFSPKSRLPVSKQFNDKLSPIYRWLDSKVGCSWDDVYSEIKSKFDVRTIAGKHIVEDHLLSSVTIGEDYTKYRPRYGYYVDDDGILRNAGRYRYMTPDVYPPGKKKMSMDEIRRWLKGRQIIVSGNKVFWADRISDNWKECKEYGCPQFHRDGTKKVRERTKKANYLPYNQINYDDPTQFRIVEVPIRLCNQGQYGRQGARLSSEDRKFWDSILERHQNSFIYVTSAQVAQKWRDIRAEEKKRHAEDLARALARARRKYLLDWTIQRSCCRVSVECPRLSIGSLRSAR